jgi:cytochrome b6-f complex iron-sulfur subunit
MTQNRRNFLLTGWKVGGALLIGAAGYTAYEALRPLASASGGGKLKLGAPSDFDTGTATYFPEGRLYVVKAKGDLFALSQKCPHLGCRVPFCESSGRFECPCHGSIFDIGGEYIQGPAPRGMDRYPLEVKNGAAVVDTSTLETGPDRGAKKYFQRAKGPSCI